MILTLRRKFVITSMLLVSVVLIAVCFGIWMYNKVNMEQQSYMTLQLTLENGEISWFEIGEDIPEDFQKDPVFVVSVEADGRTALIISNRISVSEEQLKEIVTQVMDSDNNKGELSEYDLRYFSKSDDTGSTRIAFMPLSFERNQLNEIMLITVMFIVGAFFVFFVASILLSRVALKPVERSWEEQNRFMADASHELKTPLTIILANTGILKSNPDTNSEQMIWVSSTEKEVQRMSSLVDDMLFLAKHADNPPAPEKKTVNFSVIVNTEVLAFESVAFEKGLTLEIQAEPDLRFVGEEVRLKQLVTILVENAVKYSQDNGKIKVSTKRRKGNIILSVFNEGAPIPPEQQHHLFKRFYRADASRTTQGSGLGLSIAKVIVGEHKGNITVQSDERGTVFTVLLPV
ncbi:MAG: sensor histidine kinase [Lachnospiraceae bacterium]